MNIVKKESGAPVDSPVAEVITIVEGNGSKQEDRNRTAQSGECDIVAYNLVKGIKLKKIHFLFA